MKLQPLNDKIVIKREEAEEKTSSGLYLPSGAQE
ncbi:MAG: co-chaperone GroES, partial [Gemmataceae bacterium]